MFSCGSWSEAQQWGSKVEAAQGDRSQTGEGCLVGSRTLQKMFSSQSPVVKTAVKGPKNKRWRANGEEAHFLLKGVLSPPIISHCPVESWGAWLDIFLFNCLPPFSYITGKLHRCMEICAEVLKMMLPCPSSHRHTCSQQDHLISYWSPLKIFHLSLNTPDQTSILCSLFFIIPAVLIFKSLLQCNICITTTDENDLHMDTHPIIKWYWHFPEGW